MRYLGGKSKLAREIVDVIVSMKGDRTRYVEPFVGGGSVLTRAAEHFETVEAGDLHEDLILLWCALRDGWKPPTEMTREERDALRDAPPSALRGFAGFPCSFGGKWFDAMATGDDKKNGVVTRKRNHVAESARACLSDAEKIRRVSFRRCGYAEWALDSNTVVYCDPPYVDTVGYGFDWNPTRFWLWAEEASKAGALVFVSELRAPLSRGWECVWKKARPVGESLAQSGRGGRSRALGGIQNRGKAIRYDRLFVWRGLS